MKGCKWKRVSVTASVDKSTAAVRFGCRRLQLVVEDAARKDDAVVAHEADPERPVVVVRVPVVRRPSRRAHEEAPGALVHLTRARCRAEPDGEGAGEVLSVES